MAKPWACRLGWHSWVRRYGTPDPNAQICRRCGKLSDYGGGFTGLGGGTPG